MQTQLFCTKRYLYSLPFVLHELRTLLEEDIKPEFVFISFSSKGLLVAIKKNIMPNRNIQAKIMSCIREYCQLNNVDECPKKHIVDSLSYLYYCNASKHIGNKLSDMKKRLKLINTRKGFWRLVTPDDKKEHYKKYLPELF